MEGAAEREKKTLDIGMYQAWHTAVLALNGYSGGLKNKSLSDYLISGKSEQPEKLENAKLIAGFRNLQARGFDVQISRNEIN